MQDLYKVLGVDPYANESTIKEAYRKIVKKYHPDVNANNTTEYMQSVNDAYHTLIDYKRRTEYDQQYYKDNSSTYCNNWYDDVDKWLSEIREQDIRDEQAILDQHCIDFPDDPMWRRLAELHRQNPETYADRAYSEGWVS